MDTKKSFFGVHMNFREPKPGDYVEKLSKKKWKNADSSEQRRIAVALSLRVWILLHNIVKNVISYPWTPRIHFLEFIWISESQNP